MLIFTATKLNNPIRKHTNEMVDLTEKVEEEEKGKENRSKNANWDFINSQPPRIKLALTYYIKTGDKKSAQRMAKLTMKKFEEILKRANLS